MLLVRTLLKSKEKDSDSSQKEKKSRKESVKPATTMSQICRNKRAQNQSQFK